MKIPKLFKKAAAFVMAAVTALSIMPATAFAAGDIGTIFFSHTYDSNGNAMRYNSSANIGGYTAGGTGNYKYRMFVDGENAFCIQPGVPLKTGNTLKKASSDTWNALSANQKKAVGLALLYGYQGNRNNLSGSDDEKWLATQTLVWEFVTGCREATGSYNQTSTTVYSLHFGSNYANSGARAVYDQIVAMLREHNTIPSFMSGGKNDITKELAYKDGKYSITLTDSNGVLSDYSFSSSDSNVSVSKSGNKLTISSTVAISGSVRITAKRNNVPTVSSSAKLIAYGDPNLQDLVTGVENADTVSAYINIETPTGTIALKKTSEDGVVEGISFTIKGDNFNKTVKTGKDGSVSVEGLFPGTYTVTEQSIDRYEPQKTQTVTLIGGKTSTVTFSNTLKRGSLEIVKTSEDNLVEGMKFHLYGTSLSGLPVDEYAVTDKNGLAKFENVLISGDTPYVVEEVDTAVRYVVPASQTAPIEWNKVTKRSFDNVLKKFQVTVTKTDAETGSPQGDASLAGAVYGIYKGEELIDTYTTDENGQFTTKYYICDNDWTVREISPSEGYLLDTAIHKVGAEPELYTVELNSTANDVNEQVIKGNIALIKHTDNGETQIETPEEGAVFEVFLKSAGSYENAKETERDVLTCDENGFAQTKDMPYGIYTVRQTFGWEGRELMKDFDVFISKDGQTYRYLINNANFESYIKIVKKDAETGNTIPYAGAGFQIYDPNGNLVTMTFTYPEVTTIDTFYTTADGDLITPQTLEYGKGYSLVEVQAPYGYVLNSEPVYFDVVQENSEEESGIMVAELCELNRNMMLSVDIIPVPTDEAVREVENRLLGVETNITNWQRKQNQNNNFSAVIPYDLEQQRKESKEFLDDLTTRDQRMMFAVLTMVHTADTKEQLDNDTEALLTTARKHLCQFAVLKYQQMDGLNTALPFGVRKIDALRTLTTESLAVFIPFRVQEIYHENGVYYGQNVISKNMIIANRRQLLNGNSFILGVSGAGKSFTAKEEMTNIILTDPNADIIIIDPEREYSPLVKAMQGEVIHISATSENHINAMDMNSDYGDGANPVILKSEFILSLCEQLIGGTNLGAKQKSIIDRCTASVYRYYQQGNYMGTPPTLQDFREELLKQNEPEAQEIALAIELFTDGSLNTFAKHTNVDTHSRLICYDILDLGKQLQPIGMLVVLDSILNRITQNRAKGRNTFIFIDEIYLLFQHEYSANFLFTLWKRVRKYGAYCTGITQNVDDLLQSHTARTMLANSEFIIMLNQASTDRLELAKLLNISDLQMSYITNVGAGQGLLKVGSSLVPFVNKFPRNTELYKLMTTKFGEV